MPTSVVMAAASGFLAGSTFVATATSLFSWSAFVGSLVMSGLSAALRPDAPSQDGGPAPNLSSGSRTVTVRQAISSWRVIYGTDRVGGVVTYKKVTDGNSRYHMVLTLAGHVCEAIDDIWFGDEVVPLDVDGNATGRYAGYVRVKKSLGDEAGQPFPDLVTESGGEWTDAHRQTGCTKLYVRVVANNDLFPTGLPNVTAVVRGKNDIYDPRDLSTGWSDNPALIIANYLCDATVGLGLVYADEINATDLAAAANVCDESVTLADGGSEARYTCNGSFLVSEAPVAIVGKLASAFAGHVVQIGAKWNILAGAYLVPTVELDADDLAGPLEFQSLVSRRDNCNGVKGIYVAPENNYQPTDFPAIKPAVYLAEDNNERAWHDLELSYTNSGTMAQRIAKIELLRTRQGLTVKWSGKLSCYRAQPGKTVALTLDKYGWSAKPFFVVGGRFTAAADGTLGYALDLRETAAGVFDWDASEEQAVDFAPNTDLGDPFTVEAPGTPTVSEELYETTGSAGVKARAVVAWDAVVDAFVVGYEPAYKLTADSDWIARPVVTGTRDTLDDLAPASYSFRVRAINTLGQRSAWSDTRVAELTGLTAPPAAVSGFSVIKSAGFALAQWTLSEDLDVRIGGRIIIRHSPATSGAAWTDGVIVEEFNGDAVNGLVPLMTGTYLAKAKDSSGNYSTSAASFVVTEGMVTGFTTVATSTQHATFTGSKTNTVVDGSVLQIDTLGIDATGSYDFSAALDMTTSATRRFEADISAVSFVATDLIDSRSATIDTWASIDGAEVDDCDVTLYAAITDDDPAGSPTWSAWMPFFVADFTCRAAKFKLDFAAADPTHNIAVDTLVVHVKEPT